MGIRKIVLNGDELLRKNCKLVSDYNARLAVLLNDMHETLALAEGVGLAGPQVGVLRRIVVIDRAADGQSEQEHEFIDMCNPEIIAQDGEQTGLEGCLSMPGEYGIVTRPMTVKARYFDKNGDEKTIEANGLIARAICHEIDHLNGKLYIDIAERMLSKEELEEMSKNDEEVEEAED